MKEYTITVYNVNTGKIIDTFIAEFQSVDELRDFMDSELHNYNESYLKLHYSFMEVNNVRQRTTKNNPKRY